MQEKEQKGANMKAKPTKDDHPRIIYQTPGNVLVDDTLTSGQKTSILEYWKTDLEAKLRAENEGMQAEPESSAQSLEKIAEEHQEVSKALEEAST